MKFKTTIAKSKILKKYFTHFQPLTNYFQLFFGQVGINGGVRTIVGKNSTIKPNQSYVQR